MSDFLVGAAIAADAVIKDNKHTQSQAQIEGFKLLEGFNKPIPKDDTSILPKLDITDALNDASKLPVPQPTAEELAKFASNTSTDANLMNPRPDEKLNSAPKEPRTLP